MINFNLIKLIKVSRYYIQNPFYIKEFLKYQLKIKSEFMLYGLIVMESGNYYFQMILYRSLSKTTM